MPTRFPAPSGAGVMSMRSLTRGPAATIAIAATNTLAEGNSATVTNGGSSTAASLTFGIPRGAVPAIGFNFNTATTDSDKDAGDIWFNNATPASVTTIYFDNADRDGNTQTTWLDAMDDSTSTINGQLVLTPAATPAAKLVYNVTGSVTDGTGYRKIVVTHVSGTTLPSNDAHIAVEFIRAGDKGDTGADAVIPATAFNFNTATTDSDKDAGDIWFDNATPASVTVIYFDNADRDGNTVTSWLDTFDDSTDTSVKGTITLIPALSPANKLIYNVTGSVVDGTGYRKVTVTHVAGTTLPSDNANIAVSFSRTGNKGTDGAGTGDVEASAAFTADNRIVRTDRPTSDNKNVQQTGIAVSDTDVLSPATNDAGALGSGSLSWADLFLADGGTINFNNGNLVLTHSTGVLNVSTGDLQIGGSAVLHASDIGTTVQGYDADTLKADTSDNLTAGFTATSYPAGTKSSGTYTPAASDGNFQHATNGGAHTLAPPADVCTIIVEYLNNGSAGSITTSGFTKVTGDSFTTTNGHKFACFITKTNSYSHLHVQALQ